MQIDSNKIDRIVAWFTMDVLCHNDELSGDDLKGLVKERVDSFLSYVFETEIK